MGNPTIRGANATVESENSPQWRFSSQPVECTRIFEDPSYDLLRAAPNFPKVGDPMENFGDDIIGIGAHGNVLVADVDVRKVPGDGGILTVKYLAPNADLSQSISPEQWSYKSTEVHQRLEYCPRYAALEDDERHAIAQALADRDGQSGTAALTWIQLVGAGPHADLAMELYEKLRKGEDSYVIFAPLLERITYHSSMPERHLGGCIDQFIGDPIDYLRLADEVNPHGPLWIRISRWQGA